MFYLYLYTIYNFLLEVSYTVFKLPFFKFYIKGPKITGCWENKRNEDICSILTGTPAEFWKFNVYQCEEIIENKFESYYILFSTIMYVFLIYRVIAIIWWRYFVYIPIINEIKLIIGNGYRALK